MAKVGRAGHSSPSEAKLLAPLAGERREGRFALARRMHFECPVPGAGPNTPQGETPARSARQPEPLDA